MLRRFMLMMGLLVAASLACAGEAGRIVFVAGDVQIAGQRVAAGSAVSEGDELATGSDGYAYMKTVDNGFFILRPNTRARITAYHIDSQNPANTRIKFDLLSGVARSISGEAVKQARQNFRFNTPVAAIGVRGTDFTVFTDQQTTRIAVISGGIVVSGFSAACDPKGKGPCEGPASRELFAGQAGLLQVNNGQAVPQLLRGEGASPDLVAPPRSDEPTGKTSGAGSVTAPTAAAGSVTSIIDAMPAIHEVSLDPQKSNDLLLNALLPETQAPLDAPVASVVPVVAPVTTAPAPPEVLWGRWQAVANLPADAAALAKLNGGTYNPAGVLGSFFITRVKNSELVLPNQGSASFGLVNSEAYISAAGQAPVAATIQNARLDIDFAARAFSTSLNVVAPGAQVGIYARGDITLKGELVSHAMNSNARVSGYLGGALAQEAGYLFKSTDTPVLSAFGATQWAR